MATPNFVKKDSSCYYVIEDNNIREEFDFDLLIEDITNRLKETDRDFREDNKAMIDYYKIGEIEKCIFPPLKLVFEITLNYGYYSDANLDYEIKLLYNYSDYYNRSINNIYALMDYLKEEIKYMLEDDAENDKIIRLELDADEKRENFETLDDYVYYLASLAYYRIQDILSDTSQEIEKVFKEFADETLELGGVFSNGEAVYFKKDC